MIRVFDLERSVRFYTLLGMNEVRRREVPDGRYTLVYMAFGQGNASGQAEIELTWNWDQKTPYTLGDGFGHLALGMADITAVAERVSAHEGETGGKVVRAPGPVKFGTTVIAFLADPDGYKIELIENGL
ncbi:lactoylglutathione lyase [Formicincola oecophyllae]|uniref:Aldoketomutase n=2 Tax=Formicincola oecophyllae TaxID=2558361 RepID=A0A4Y6UBZ0_9PROT|nr:lactoylglutathione lyase [Formicincola oecophyllae]